MRGFVEVVEDIRERKRLEAALAKSYERSRLLADMLEYSSQPFAAAFFDGRLKAFNAAFCNLLGYREDALRKKDWLDDLPPPEWRKTQMQHLEELLRTGNPVRFEKGVFNRIRGLIGSGKRVSGGGTSGPRFLPQPPTSFPLLCCSSGNMAVVHFYEPLRRPGSAPAASLGGPSRRAHNSISTFKRVKSSPKHGDYREKQPTGVQTYPRILTRRPKMGLSPSDHP